MRRWICPQCGSGVNAPDAPRKDDARRYCLTCTGKTGRLVERTCPALDRQRAERSVKQAARTQTRRERDRAAEVAARTAGPYDLLAEAKRFARLPAIKNQIDRYGFPTITFRRTTGSKAFTSGHCRYCVPAEITVTIGCDPHGAVETVMHEMVHAALLTEGHSDRFWYTLRSLAKEAFPDARFDFVHVRQGWQTDSEIGRAIGARHQEAKA